jgi:hypothetical protein
VSNVSENEIFGDRWIATAAELQVKVEKFCEGGSKKELRLEARCSNVHGWTVINEGRNNACKKLSSTESPKAPERFRDEWNDYDTNLITYASIASSLILVVTFAWHIGREMEERREAKEGLLAWFRGSESAPTSTYWIGLMRVILAIHVLNKLVAGVREGELMVPEGGVGEWFVRFGIGTTAMAMAVGFAAELATMATGCGIVWLYFYYGEMAGIGGFSHYSVALLGFTLMWLGLTPCGNAYSLWRIMLQPKQWQGYKGNLWAAPLLRLQLSTFYFWSAVSKVNWAFLSGERAEIFFLYYTNSHTYPSLPYFHEICLFLSVSLIIFEFSLPVFLWFPRLRSRAVTLLVSVHMLQYLIFQVDTITILAILPLFLPQQKIHTFIERFHGKKKKAQKK